jgi:hypothetical protein
VLDRLGISLIEPARQGCCGAVQQGASPHHEAVKAGWKSFAEEKTATAWGGGGPGEPRSSAGWPKSYLGARPLRVHPPRPQVNAID